VAESPRFLLIGDSHAGAIGRAARADGIPFAGGPLGSGRAFFEPFVTMEGALPRFHAEEAAGHFTAALRALGMSDLAGLKMPVISTLGLSPHFPATREIWACCRDGDNTPDPGFLESDLFTGIVAEMVRPALEFHRALSALGLELHAVTAPQRVPDLSDPALYRAIQSVLLELHAEAGASILDLRAQSGGADGWLAADYAQPADPLHANPAYGRLVLQALGLTSGPARPAG
jgi:hypothetical protein